MKITIEATPKEVKDLIQGIASNNEENTNQEEKGITDVLRGVDGGFAIGGIEYDPGTGEGSLEKMESKKGVLITMKIGENEMKGFVSKVSDKEVSSEESLEFYNSTFEG